MILYNNEKLDMTVEEAEKYASSLGLDLIQVATDVYKIMDYNKYLYNKKKQAKQVVQKTSEIKIKPLISDNDLNTKINKIKELLNKKHTVTVNIIIRIGRVMYSDKANQICNIICKEVNKQVTPTIKGNFLTFQLK